MSRSIKITVELSDELCEWVESLIFSEEIPAQVAEVAEKEEIKEKKEKKDSHRFKVDPENPLGKTVHESFIKLHHMPVSRISARAEEHLGFTPKLGTKPYMVDQILHHMYGDEMMDHHSSKFEKSSDLVDLALEVLKEVGEPMTISDIRDALYKEFMFNPQHLYDGLSRIAKKGVVAKTEDGLYCLRPLPSLVYGSLSDLAREAVSQLDTGTNTMRDVAVLVISDLELQNTPTDCARLKAAMMHILTAGIFTVRNTVDVDFAGEGDVDENLLLERCKEWLEGMRG